jgi:hypothetical protein
MNCKKCGKQIPEGRLKALPTTTTCINCSGIQKKGAVTLMKGEGDHTWIETIHLEHEDYKAYMEAENKMKKGGTLLFNEPEEKLDIPYGFSETKLDKLTE